MAAGVQRRVGGGSCRDLLTGLAVEVGKRSVVQVLGPAHTLANVWVSTQLVDSRPHRLGQFLSSLLGSVPRCVCRAGTCFEPSTGAGPWGHRGEGASGIFSDSEPDDPAENK